ncbi:hypothetical protein NC653_005865 [Populus alba x Populus x berolinensis]|uniref:Uncharacterized protein n=1 Tax=Populus alba x Populus x berolinensis TaxID=444605 RepID=A0AAD6RE07_9ROSI|nr:hypothetical protein NC653_005865 [Populus alba x Populus x berolinensis]
MGQYSTHHFITCYELCTCKINQHQYQKCFYVVGREDWGYMRNFKCKRSHFSALHNSMAIAACKNSNQRFLRSNILQVMQLSSSAIITRDRARWQLKYRETFQSLSEARYCKMMLFIPGGASTFKP